MTVKVTWPRSILLAIFLVLFAAWYVPRIGAGQYRDRAQSALETALGRKVEIGEIRFRLLPAPGFTISDVRIGEDPKIGDETFAYVTTLRAVPRITSLFGGKLEFASVDLLDTSLNLTRVDKPQSGVNWNFASLMRPETLAAFPSIHMRGGRINFKFDDSKSIFYLLNTDVDLWPPDSSQGPWTVKLHAEPARTDRPARGFGSFVARGQWLPRESQTILDVKLEQSELSDVLTLFNGYESNLLGDVVGDAHLAGPLNRIGITGRMTVSDIHGWNQVPPGGNGWRFDIGGAIDLPGQAVDLNARIAGSQTPLQLRYRVSDYLRRPRWGVTVNLNHFPIAPIPDIARNLGIPVPADYKFEGTASGAVGYSMPAGSPRMDGAMNLSDATFVVAGTPPLHMPNAGLRFSGSTVSLQAAEITNASNESAAITGSFDVESRNLSVEVSSDGMSIASLKSQVAYAGIPLLGQTTSGTWKGDLRYSDGSWSGAVNLMNADVPFEAFAQPVHVVSVDAAIDGPAVSMKNLDVTMGDITATGDYRYEPGAARPHKFRIAIPAANGAAIEKLLTPTLRRGSFLNYAFNFGRVPEPGWLRNMRADGIIQTGTLEIAGEKFSKLRTRVVWEGTSVQLTALETQYGAAKFKGAATIRVAGRQPVYDITGRLTQFDWRNGTIDAEGALSTSGFGKDLLANLKMQGTFDGHDLDLSASDSYDSVTGAFEWASDTRSPRLRVPQLVMKSGPDTWLGTAEMGENGQVLVKISDGSKRLEAAGAILRGEALKPVP
jgi:hypothetical protein